MDSRIKKLANLLVTYSVDLKPGEKCLIDYEGTAVKPLVRQLIKEIYQAGGIPYVTSRDSSVNREIMLHVEKEQLSDMCRWQLARMQDMQAYIAVRGTDNASELSDIPSEKMALWNKMLDPVLRYRVDKTKWVVLRYPNNAMAQLSNTSLETFENFILMSARSIIKKCQML